MSKRKHPGSSNNHNSDFCDVLMELAEYEKNVIRNIHKYNAYRKAASVLSTHNKRIESGDEAKSLSGIGDKIAKKIDEIIHSGKLQKLENIHNDEAAQAISILTSVSGIGPATARNLLAKGIKSIEDLEKYKDQLTHHQRIGLKYVKDFQLKIPREEIQQIELKIKDSISKIDSNMSITVCGSYRRGKFESGDIDVLLTHKKIHSCESKNRIAQVVLRNVVDTFTELGIVTETLSLGETKFMGACRVSEEKPMRRLDIRLIAHDQYYCAILYFTGSDMFNKAMRTHALDQGFTLNEYALRPLGETGVLGEPVPITSEQDIFDFINLPYRQPCDRDV